MARDGGRPCGCDPKIDHECEGHGMAFDPSTTIISDNLVVRGPFKDSRIVLDSFSTPVNLTRFQAEDLLEEIKRRLDLRG